MNKSISNDYYMWVGEMEAALEDKDRVFKANAPFRAENLRVERENQRIERENEVIERLNAERAVAGKRLLATAGIFKKHSLAPHHTTVGTQRVFDRERRARADLARRSGAEWAERVGRIADPAVRLAVGSIVWWDFFGGRRAVNRWDDLDEIINAKFVPAPEEAVKGALWGVGYTPYMVEIKFLQTKGRGRRE